MPNQLSRTKRRQSIAEHRAVLATIETIALRENRTVVDVLREAIRELIKRRAEDLNLAAPMKIEARNSLAHPNRPIRLIGFENAHATR